MKLDKEQIYHIIDLLEINIKSDKHLLSEPQIKDSIKYDRDIIDVLNCLIGGMK